MYYRRNTDTQLRDLERAFQADTTNRELLKQIDAIRQRAGMPPHPRTRLAVAEERVSEMNYQSFMLLKDLAPHLQSMFENSREVQLYPEIINDYQFIPEIQYTLEVASEAGSEIRNASIGHKMYRGWATYLKRNKIRLSEEPTPDPSPKELIEGTSMFPHLERPDMAERYYLAEKVMREAYAKCREFLRDLSRFALLNAHNLQEAFQDQDDELVEVLLGVEKILYHWDLAHEEELLARLGAEPNKEFKDEMGDDLWWKHLES